MSTKTTFKRIALVAVAALGLGVMSVAPSQAATSGLAIAVTNGTAGNAAGLVADTTTAALATVTALTTEAADTITVTAIRKSNPTSGTGPSVMAHLGLVDTGTVSTGVKRTIGGSALVASVSGANVAAVFDSTTAFNTAVSQAYVISGDAGYKSATFNLLLDTATAPQAGTYTYTVVATVYSALGAYVSQSTQDVSIVVAALASASKVVDASKSTATLSSGTTLGSATAGTDDAVSTLATASATIKASIRVINNNNSSTAVAESITVTVTGPGVVRKSGETSSGKSIVVVGDGNDDIEILSDGTAGVASIVVKTTSITYPAKSVIFYAAAPSTSVASVAKPVVEANGSSTLDTVRATLNDSNGNRWAGDAYIYATSAASALIAGSETPVLCSFDAADNRHECPVTGKTVGSATFKVIDASTVAAATLSSNEVTVRSSASIPASFKLVFDKATYAPGEKAVLSVVPVDAAGASVAGKTYTDLLAAGGITPSIAFSSGSDTLTATAIVVSGSSSSTSGTTAGQRNYTVYMPYASGDITVTATGGTGLPVAARVAVTATASVANPSVDAATDAANEATDATNAATDAALAAADAADAATAAAQDASDAVAALSASVSKMISNLRAQITSLTNLVIKIQKKVKA